MICKKEWKNRSFWWYARKRVAWWYAKPAVWIKKERSYYFVLFWWGEMDSNHRSRWQQIYSLPPLATREPPHFGAGDWNRTHNLLITSQLLCLVELRQHINFLLWCLGAESNHRHGDFQSPALPTELPRHFLATWKGLEPSTSSVTG